MNTPNLMSRRAAAGAAHGPGAGLGVGPGPAVPRLGGRLVARYCVLYAVLYCTVLMARLPRHRPRLRAGRPRHPLLPRHALPPPAAAARPGLQQQRPRGHGGGHPRQPAVPAGQVLCTVLYCTVRYCTVLCTGQPRRGQRQPPDRRPRCLPAQVRGDTVPAVRRSDPFFIVSTVLQDRKYFKSTEYFYLFLYISTDR